VDPLYLTNRTWRQKAILWAAVATPLTLLLAAVVYVLLVPPRAREQAPAQLSPAEIAARTVIIPKDFTFPQNKDLQVTEAAVEHGAAGSFLTGTLQNNTDRSFAGAELAFELLDERGSMAGGAGGRAPAVGPRGTVRFRIPIEQREAVQVTVRGVRGLN
jgi:hypothetical protein